MKKIGFLEDSGALPKWDFSSSLNYLKQNNKEQLECWRSWTWIRLRWLRIHLVTIKLNIDQLTKGSLHEGLYKKNFSEWNFLPDSRGVSKRLLYCIYCNFLHQEYSRLLITPNF